jgi:hypothetical protein
MRILIPALAPASFLALSLPSYSADEVKSEGTSTRPVRAIDDGSVKAAGASDKPGRAVEDGTVKSGAAATKPARAADSEKKAAKKKKKKMQPQ